MQWPTGTRLCTFCNGLGYKGFCAVCSGAGYIYTAAPKAVTPPPVTYTPVTPVPVTPSYGGGSGGYSPSSGTQNYSQSSSNDASYYQAQYDKEKRYKEKLEQDLKDYNNPLSPYYSSGSALRLSTQNSIQESERRMRDIQAEARRNGYSVY